MHIWHEAVSSLFSWTTVSQHFCSIFTDFRVQNCQASECAVRKSDNMENASHNLHKLTQVVQPVGAYPCPKNLGMPLLEDEWLILLRSLRGEVLCLVLASSQLREARSLGCSRRQSPTSSFWSSSGCQLIDMTKYKHYTNYDEKLL